MSQASGQAMADARVRELREEGLGHRAVQKGTHDDSVPEADHGVRPRLNGANDLGWSDEPLFDTDKYRRAVPLFRPEQLKG